jgi:DNA repair protein RadA/Sms
MVFFGEVSLSGALRPVAQSESRLKEAAKLGFTRAALAAGSKAGGEAGMTLQPMPDLAALAGGMFGAG